MFPKSFDSPSLRHSAPIFAPFLRWKRTDPVRKRSAEGILFHQENTAGGRNGIGVVVSFLMIACFILVASFAAALLVARLFGQPGQLTERQRARLEVDRLLDELGLAELRGVARVSRQLASRQRGRARPITS